MTIGPKARCAQDVTTRERMFGWLKQTGKARRMAYESVGPALRRMLIESMHYHISMDFSRNLGFELTSLLDSRGQPLQQFGET